MLKTINSNVLKILAMIFMMVDHIGAIFMPKNQLLRMIGRLSFPIFAFLIVEGFLHTSDFKKYVKRLFLFGIIAEIPFDLAFFNTFFYPNKQNVMFTMLLGILSINELEKIKNNEELKIQLLSVFKIVMYLVISLGSLVDYRLVGVLTVIIFYIFRNVKLYWVGQLLSMMILHSICIPSRIVTVSIKSLQLAFTAQSIAVLSLVLIWLYNGKRGAKNKVLQYAFYAFYPVHLLILHLIK